MTPDEYKKRLDEALGRRYQRAATGRCAGGGVRWCGA